MVGEKFMSKTIIERAKEYAPDAPFPDEILPAREQHLVDLERRGYIEGATDEHELLTRWNDPDNPPNKAENILIKYKREKEEDSIELYEVGYWNGKAYFSTYDYDYLPNIIGWREIHE